MCAEESPCQGAGSCQANVCVRSGVVRSLQPTWTFDSRQVGNPDAGVPAAQYHDFVLEPDGGATLSGFFFSPTMLRANGPSPMLAPLGPSRRCILWNGNLACADYPAAPSGQVSAVSLADGSLLWTYQVQPRHPDYVQQTSTLFVSRLAVLGSDRLAALFEAYPAAPQGPTLCRAYFLVLLDVNGFELTARQLHDPLLDVCNHPHPYGAAADAMGNLYVSFSPTVAHAGTNKPDRPTLLMSFNREGAWRWCVTDPTLQGGELAVARGLLYPENASRALVAATGMTAFTLPNALGRGVVAATRVIPAPQTGSTSLAGLEAGTVSSRWTHQLRSTESFYSDQIRLASWATSQGQKTVALTWVRNGGQVLLHGIDVSDGSEAFSCPVAHAGSTPPQLFELANGSLTAMDGALDASGNPGCGTCDPPFVGSSATFFTLPVPGLGVPREPWLGTFGGPSHDQHEVQVP